MLTKISKSFQAAKSNGPKSRSVFSRATPAKPRTTAPPTNLELTQYNRGMDVKYLDSRVCSFHWVWLRDHCNCTQCRSSSGQKLWTISKWLPPKVNVAKADLKGDNIEISWYDGHKTNYSVDWLRKNAYQTEDIVQRIVSSKTPTWDKQIMMDQGGIPSFEYKSIMEDDSAFHQWLTKLNHFGLTLLKNAPAEKGIVKQVCERVGYPRNTMYGVTWDVESVPNPNNVAYTSLALPLHQDLLYYENPPGVQLLHCIKFEQATGGDNIFADGFKVAEILAKQDSKLFDTLCENKNVYHKDDETNHLRHAKPIIEMDGATLKAINWAPPFEGTQIVMDEQMERFYYAKAKWEALLNKDANLVYHRLQPGEIVVFNNRRVLHARTAFDEKSGHRLLEGGYIDGDEWVSKLRVLNRKYSPNAVIYQGSAQTL